MVGRLPKSLHATQHASRIECRGAAEATLSAAFGAALASPALRGIVLCPSNPFLSVQPILAVPGVRTAIARCPRVLAVSPIIAGQAVKGPAAKLMRELGMLRWTRARETWGQCMDTGYWPPYVEKCVESENPAMWALEREYELEVHR